MHVDWRDFGRALVQYLSVPKFEPPVMPFLTQAKLKGIRVNKGAAVVCTDIANPEPVWFDGTNWIRFSDRTAI
jgi:hypothetical protein